MNQKGAIMSEQVNMDDLMLETSVAAEMIGVPPRTLIRMADNNKVPCTRTPGGPGGMGHRRFRVKDIVKLRDSGAPEIERANTTISDDLLASTVTTAEARRILGVSYNTIRKFEEDGKIQAIRPPIRNKVRYDRASVEALAKARSKKGSK